MAAVPLHSTYICLTCTPVPHAVTEDNPAKDSCCWSAWVQAVPPSAHHLSTDSSRLSDNIHAPAGGPSCNMIVVRGAKAPTGLSMWPSGNTVPQQAMQLSTCASHINNWQGLASVWRETLMQHQPAAVLWKALMRAHAARWVKLRHSERRRCSVSSASAVGACTLGPSKQ